MLFVLIIPVSFLILLSTNLENWQINFNILLTEICGTSEVLTFIIWI